MKKIIGILAMSAITIGLAAQQNVLDKHFAQYQENDDFSKISISGKVFEMTAYLETEDEDLDEIKEFAQGITGLKMLIGEDQTNWLAQYQSATKKVEKDYEELMSVDDKDGKFTFYIDEKNGVVKEFVAVGTTDSTLVLVSLIGKMDLRQLGSISGKIQNEGFGYINKMNEHGANKIKIYPNPATEGSLIDVEIPGELDGATLKIFDLNGRLVKSQQITSTRMTIQLNEMQSGQYIMEFTKGGSSIKKKLNVN